MAAAFHQEHGLEAQGAMAHEELIPAPMHELRQQNDDMVIGMFGQQNSETQQQRSNEGTAETSAPTPAEMPTAALRM